MTVVPLPLDPGSEARTILHHLLEHGDLAVATPPDGRCSCCRLRIGCSSGS